MLLDRRIDVVTFTSASAVRNFVRVLGAEPAADLLRTTIVASIGPVTAEAAAQCHIHTTIMPSQYTVAALVDAIVEHFARSPSSSNSRRSRLPQSSCPAFAVVVSGVSRTDRSVRFPWPELQRRQPDRHINRTGTSRGCMSSTATHARSALKLTRRLRRLRRSETMRALVRETRLSPEMFVLPLFVCEGEGVRREVSSMPGVYNLSVDEAVKEAARARAAGVKSVLLFGLPDAKDDIGSAAYDPEAPVQAAIRAIKRNTPDVLVITDVCLCEYTDHGHCGIVIDDEIANDPTVDQLVRVAVSHAAAGADIVAPSDMMDGRVGAIRQALDERGFENTAILSYAAKYCSAFYGPFRDAAGSTPKFGDRRSHQMDPANVAEALREVALDIEEGADMVMVKPALPYLDVIARVKERFQYPTAAYHVSGEYAMLKAAARNGWIDERRAMLETLTAIRRAGADIIITYYAVDAARALA